MAEAWQGRHIAGSIRQFLEMNRGQHAETIRADGREFAAGGAAHLVAFVGHNGLMDFAVPELHPGNETPCPGSPVVLACYSDFYFSKLLRPHAAAAGHDASLMAPEAYVLDAALIELVRRRWPGEVVGAAAASAYAQYQKISGPLGAKDFLTASLIIRRRPHTRRPIAAPYLPKFIRNHLFYLRFIDD